MTNTVALEAVRRHLHRSKAAADFQMKHRLRGLATIALVAPMVGCWAPTRELFQLFAGIIAAVGSRPSFAVYPSASYSFALGLAVGNSAFGASRQLSHYAEELDLEMARAAGQLLEYLDLR